MAIAMYMTPATTLTASSTVACGASQDQRTITTADRNIVCTE